MMPRGGTRGTLDEFLQVMLSVLSGVDLDETLRKTVEAARHLVHARYGALGIRARDGSTARFIFSGMTPEAYHRIADPPRGRGLLGLLMDRPRPLRLDDLSAHPASAGFPAHHPPMRSFLGVPVRVRGEVFGTLYLTEKAAAAPFSRGDQSAIEVFATVAGAAIDNARRLQRYRLRESWLRALHEVTTQFLQGGGSRQALQLVVDRTAELSHSVLAFVALAKEQAGAGLPPQQLVVTVSTGRLGDSVVGRRIAVDGSVLGAAARDGLPHELDGLDGEVGEAAPAGPGLVLPLTVDGTNSGVLVTVRAAGAKAFDADERQVLSAFAGQAALGLHLARAQRLRRELDVLADRDRIARDLHDDVIQRLFATGLQLETAAHGLDDGDLARRLTGAADQLHEIIDEIRETIFELQGAGREPLRRRLYQVVERLTADTNLRVAVQMSGPVDVVPAQRADDVESVITESVSNAVRHAHASELSVSVVAGDRLTIDVRDDGIGVPDRPRRRGLDNIRHRAERWGGSSSVTRPVRGGTWVQWSIPLIT